jgi:hypothetical protein
MVAGLVRFIVVVLAFYGLGQLLGLPAWMGFFVGAVLGLAIEGYFWYQRKDQVFTARELARRPFGTRVPDAVDQAFDAAPALAGNDTYSQRVAGSWHYLQNFGELRNLADLPDGALLEVQAALVIEPANEHSRHAVSVSVAGYIVGYIPELESESLYSFLQNHRGIARVNSNVYLNIASGEPRVELDLTRPYKIVTGV